MFTELRLKRPTMANGYSPMTLSIAKVTPATITKTQMVYTIAMLVITGFTPKTITSATAKIYPNGFSKMTLTGTISLTLMSMTKTT